MEKIVLSVEFKIKNNNNKIIIQFPILKNSNHQYVSFLSNYLSNLQPCGLVDITVNKFKAMWFCL